MSRSLPRRWGEEEHSEQMVQQEQRHNVRMREPRDSGAGRARDDTGREVRSSTAILQKLSLTS